MNDERTFSNEPTKPLFRVPMERTDVIDDPEMDLEDDPLLAAPCRAPGCPLLNGDHSPEEVMVCLERWLTALADREAAR